MFLFVLFFDFERFLNEETEVNKKRQNYPKTEYETRKWNKSKNKLTKNHNSG